MATTLTLQNSINYALPILKNQPALVSNFEPALSVGNIVLATILGPPFCWRFNRNTLSFSISSGAGTDYAESLPDFGFLETQWLTDGTTVHELGGAVSLAKTTASARPTKIAPQYDDNAGNITFRVNRLPDKSYTVNGDYQKKAVLMTSPASPWGVVPDEFCYIFNQGFLALLAVLVNDSRFPVFENYFVSRLLGAQDGLTDQQRNIFVGNWTNLAATLKRSDGAVISAIAGRAK